MNNRVTSESGSAVSLFPFLAVLLCTMGALLVLLVVLAQRAGERVAEQPNASSAVAPKSHLTDKEADDSRVGDVAELRHKLAAARVYKKKLADLRQQADQRLLDEQQRLAHLEEHSRRLEHELARLALANDQLLAAEGDQSIDQKQAEHELARLRGLIQEKNIQLDDLRDRPQGKRSYAIVPYRGANGTYRKPIYIECRKDGIILHPEGIRLKPSDFVDTSWAGNPLAAAIRATRQHVNAQAALAGAPEPPNPYPLILVRPDGIRKYSLARAAITAWDADFGYEFIDSDWQLSFPESADPQLARIQQHAILQAREQLTRLIRSAPRRFRGLAGGKHSKSGYGNGTGGSRGHGLGGDGQEWGEDEQFSDSHSGGVAAGEKLVGNSASKSHAGSKAAGQDRAGGEGHETGAGDNEAGTFAGDSSSLGGTGGEGATESFGDLESTSGESDLGDRYAQRSTGSVGTGGVSSSGSGTGTGKKQAATGGSAGGNAASGSSAPGGVGASSSLSSIAESQGRNWAVQNGKRGSVPVQRPIQVVIRKGWLALLPGRHKLEDADLAGQKISLDQPMQQVSEAFVVALKTHIDEWGIAGSGLYWRPVLRLHVSPDAEQTASQVVRLLKNSGVEVSFPRTASAPGKVPGLGGGAGHATR